MTIAVSNRYTTGTDLAAFHGTARRESETKSLYEVPVINHHGTVVQDVLPNIVRPCSQHDRFWRETKGLS